MGIEWRRILRHSHVLQAFNRSYSTKQRKRGLVATMRVLNKVFFRQRDSEKWQLLPPPPVTTVSGRDMFELCGQNVYVLKQLQGTTCRLFSLDIGSKILEWKENSQPSSFIGDIRCFCSFVDKIFIFTQRGHTWVYDTSEDKWSTSEVVNVHPFYQYNLQKVFVQSDRIIGDFGKCLRIYEPNSHQWISDLASKEEKLATILCSINGKVVAFNSEGVCQVLEESDGTWVPFGKVRKGVCEVTGGIGDEAYIEVYYGLGKYEFNWDAKKVYFKEDLWCDQLRGYFLLRYVH